MRRKRRLRLSDIPRLIVIGIVEVAGLFGGRYRRTEGAHVYVTDDAGRVLAVRSTYMGPGWMLPGGRIERNEAPHDGAARETREETGIQVEVDRLMLVDARPRNNVSFIYSGHMVGGTLEPQLGEISEAGWIERAEIERTSESLHQLLEQIDAAGDGVAYLGLDSARD